MGASRGGVAALAPVASDRCLQDGSTTAPVAASRRCRRSWTREGAEKRALPPAPRTRPRRHALVAAPGELETVGELDAVGEVPAAG
jgi:hypothetical protein